jgi:hypothetical protein
MKCELLRANNKLLNGPGQTGKIQHGREQTKGSVKLMNKARMDAFVRCFKK